MNNKLNGLEKTWGYLTMNKTEKEQLKHDLKDYISKVENNLKKKGAYEEWYLPLFQMADTCVQYIKPDVLNSLAENVWKEDLKHE